MLSVLVWLREANHSDPPPGIHIFLSPLAKGLPSLRLNTPTILERNLQAAPMSICLASVFQAHSENTLEA